MMGQKEPVVSAASLAGLISAILLFMRLGGWIDWSDEMFNQFMIVVSLALPIVTGLWARSRVTPVDNPQIVTESGKTVPLVRADSKLPPAVHP